MFACALRELPMSPKFDAHQCACTIFCVENAQLFSFSNFLNTCFRVLHTPIFFQEFSLTGGGGAKDAQNTDDYGEKRLREKTCSPNSGKVTQPRESFRRTSLDVDIIHHVGNRGLGGKNAQGTRPSISPSLPRPSRAAGE